MYFQNFQYEINFYISATNHVLHLYLLRLALLHVQSILRAKLDEPRMTAVNQIG